MKKMFSIRIIKIIIFHLLVFGCQSLIGQANLLELKNKTNFSFDCKFKIDKAYKFSHYIYYDDRNLIEEEFCHHLEIDIFDYDSILIDTVYQLQEDSNCIRCFYELLIGNSTQKSSGIEGWIKILNRTNEKIEVQMNIYIYRQDKLYYSYIGKEEFLYAK